MNPTHPLPSRTNPPAKAQAREHAQPSQRAAASPTIAPDHKARSQHNLPLRGQRTRRKRIFPRTPNNRRQANPKRRILITNNARRITVNMSRAHLHPHRRRCTHRPHRPPKHQRGFNPRSQNLVLMVRSLDAVHRPPGQVHNRPGIVQRLNPRPGRASIPRNMPPVANGHARSRRRPRKDDNLVSPRSKMRGQRNTKKPTPTRDHDSIGIVHVVA